MMPNTKALARRTPSRILIYPRFQLKLVALNLVSMILAAAAISWIVHHSFLNMLDQGLAAHLPADSPYFRFLGYQEKLVLGYLGVGMLAALVLSSISILVLSHRLAGPIVRLRTYLAGVVRDPKIAAQKPLAFRKADFFDDLPDEVNGAVQACLKAGATRRPGAA